MTYEEAMFLSIACEIPHVHAWKPGCGEKAHVFWMKCGFSYVNKSIITSPIKHASLIPHASAGAKELKDTACCIQGGPFRQTYVFSRGDNQTPPCAATPSLSQRCCVQAHSQVVKGRHNIIFPHSLLQLSVTRSSYCPIVGYKWTCWGQSAERWHRDAEKQDRHYTEIIPVEASQIGREGLHTSHHSYTPIHCSPSPFPSALNITMSWKNTSLFSKR